MRISTLLNHGMLRGLSVAVICAMGFAASAQTFLYEGVIYKVSKGTVTVQPTKIASGANKGKPTVCENGEAPDQYTGDVVIPTEVTYNDVTYPVASVGNGFKESLITSITIPDGVALGRGSFQSCAELLWVKLPSDLAQIQGNTFQDCVKLTEMTIPGSVTKVAAAALAGCTALETLTIEESTTPLVFARDVFNNTSPSIKKLVLNRPLDETAISAYDNKPFRSATALEEVVIGGAVTSISESFFENSALLNKVTFESAITSLSTNVFAGTGLVEVTLPETITSVSGSLFANCKSLVKVTLGSAVTSIGSTAFQNTALADINFPATLTSIGDMAFSGAQLAGDVVLPEAVKSIGMQAFANNAGITSITIPASVTSIGTGAFMGCSGIAKFVVDPENTVYAASADNTYITDKAGEVVVAYAPAATATEFTGNFKEVAPYAFYGATNLTTISLPECTTWGDYSLRGSGVTAINIDGTVGRYVAADCPNLATAVIGCKEVPMGICYNCANLTDVTLSPKVTIVRQDAFGNCPKVESLDLGNILVILETNCFRGSGIKNLTVASTFPASMADGVFIEGDEITVTVPVDCVEAYKAATGWGLLNIVGDANLAAGGSNMGMPAGMYYAGDDNDLHCVYADGQTDDYDINMQHTFQLVEFGNRIYGASAGNKFWYEGTASAVTGDGKLFYISQVDDNLFQAVVLDNTGNNAYKDPTGLYIYGSTLYVNDRNVCVRKISADALALPQDYPSWMENNWMSFYGPIWTYGCIKNGFAITQDQDASGNPEPRYWVGMKYNGNGLFSFKEGNIGSSSDEVGSAAGANAYLTDIGLIATCFNIDAKNGDLYMYIETAGTEATQIKGGLYRIKMEALEQNPTPSAGDFFTALEAQLIDGSPVKYEGNATNEHVGISQLCFDAAGEYMYWCYRAPSPEEAAINEGQDYNTQNSGRYWWAEAYDENNPLHHSGIKRIKLGEENPVVEMVIPDVTGYGIVNVNYEGSTKPEVGVTAPVVETKVVAVAVADGIITAVEDANVAIYNAAGTLVKVAALAAGQTLDTADLVAGIYLVDARTAAGDQVVKIVK